MPSKISFTKWAGAFRVHLAVARRADAAMASTTLRVCGAGGRTIGEPVDGAVALGDEHGDGVVGRHPGDPTSTARGSRP